jgi:undecaprenyl-diphosphatase
LDLGVVRDDLDTPTTSRRPVAVAAAGAIGLLLIGVWAFTTGGDDGMSVGEALLLGVVEGLTEYLPVSSTGHLTVLQDLLGITDTESGREAANAYAIIIQAGAIAAVGWLYRHRLLHAGRSVLGSGTDEGRRLGFALVLGFIPAGLLAFVFGDVIKDRLFGIWPTVVAWVVGGIVLLVWSRHERSGTRPFEAITARDGLIVGLFQIVALWPGTSRSLATILGGLAVGLTLRAAVEFSFLLGFLTLGIATAYEALDSGAMVLDEFGVLAPALGFFTATIAAAAAVVWMLRYLEERGLALFGWYRLAIAGVVTALVLTTGL